MTNQRPRHQRPWVLSPRVLGLVGLASLAAGLAAWRILGAQERLDVAITSWPGNEYL
jgi:hypothetical protein